jgi:hypothetical protein
MQLPTNMHFNFFIINANIIINNNIIIRMADQSGSSVCDFLNIASETYVTKQQITISSALLIFYVLAISSFCNIDLLGRQFRDFIKNDRTAKHLFGLLTMLILFVLVAGVKDAKYAVLYTFIGYTWFIMTTKLDIQWNLIVIMVLVFGFLYENQLLHKEDRVNKDTILTSEEKKSIENKHSKYKIYVLATAMGITVLGTALYATKKAGQYGSDFNITKFILDGPNN